MALPPVPAPPTLLTATIPAANGAPAHITLGVWEAPVVARVTVAGLLDYSGNPQGFLPGTGQIDAAGRYVGYLNSCSLQLSVRVVGYGFIGGYMGGCPNSPLQNGTYTNYAIVSGEIYADRVTGPPGSCYFGGSPCTAITGEETVEVEPLDGADLAITSTNIKVAPGASVRVDVTPTPTYLAGVKVPWTFREFRWEGQGPTAGGGQTNGCYAQPAVGECVVAVYQSGYVVAEAIVNGRLKTKKIWVEVLGGDSLPPPPPDSVPADTIPTDTIPGGGGGGGGCAAVSAHGLTLAACDTINPPIPSFICTPGSLVRALQVSCKVALTPAIAFTLDSIKGQSGTSRIGGPSNTSITAGNTFDWTGPAVESSRVFAWITFDSSGTQVQYFLTDSFTVQARSWSELDILWPAPLVFRNTVDSAGRVQTTPVPTRTGYSMVLGLHVASNPKFEVADIGQVGTGPNTGLYFLTKQISFQRSPRIYTTPAFVRGAVFNDQNGGRGAHLPRCTQGQWSGVYQAEAERHEGVTQATNSHWGIYRTQLGVRKLNQEFEGLVSDQGNPYFLLTEIALRYSDWLQNTLLPLQIGLDVQDIGTVIPQTVGCEPDFDPTDG